MSAEEIQGTGGCPARSAAGRCQSAADPVISVMAAIPVVVARPTIPSVSSASASEYTTRSTPKGAHVNVLLAPARDLMLMRTSYVEMLEQQQAQLVSGLQELYRRIVAGERWIGPLLEDGGAGDGLPRTHDILHQLGALRLDTLAGDEASSAPFEEDFFVLQRRLYESGAPPMLRHRSLSLESEADRPSPRGAAAPAAAASLRTTADSPDGHNSFPLTPPSKMGLPAPLEIPTTHATALRDTTSASSSSSTLRGHWPYVIPVMDFLDQYSPTSALEHVAPHGQGSCAGGGPCLGQEWQDEAEFKALFGDVVG